ncbi:MAG: hypothetical protein O3C60_20525 [Planctomycetota bacterium]|nr:hypothetical protein [Planctomycetota bacterium]
MNRPFLWLSSPLSRRDYLKKVVSVGGTAAACALMPSHRRLWGQAGSVSLPTAAVVPGRMQVRTPVLNLEFAEDLGMAQWWLPEIILPGYTDKGPKPPQAVHWQTDEKNSTMSYAQNNEAGDAHLAVEVSKVALGWRASMTITNRSPEVWPDVVCVSCLLLHASHLFVDPEWKQTYYRTNQQYKTYHGRERQSGQPIYQMSLVQGRRHLVRSERHIKKWGFTVEPSDDGIIAVTNQQRQTTLVTTWDSTHHLQANRKPTFSCIHANPYFGTLDPGASRTVRGCVLLVPGGLDEAWKQARAS